jgi:hypothetical protein
VCGACIYIYIHISINTYNDCSDRNFCHPNPPCPIAPQNTPKVYSSRIYMNIVNFHCIGFARVVEKATPKEDSCLTLAYRIGLCFHWPALCRLESVSELRHGAPRRAFPRLRRVEGFSRRMRPRHQEYITRYRFLHRQNYIIRSLFLRTHRPRTGAHAVIYVTVPKGKPRNSRRGGGCEPAVMSRASSKYSESWPYRRQTCTSSVGESLMVAAQWVACSVSSHTNV